MYPKYGKESAQIVVKKLNQYFGLYNQIAWTSTKPSYFIRNTDLIYYTNGSIDLKLYYKYNKNAYKNSIKDDFMIRDYSKFKSAADLIYLE